VKRAACWLGAVCVLLAGCGTAPVRSTGNSYTVKAGDTLYSIASRYGLDYHDLARLNRIGRDYRIYVGQSLVLPARARSVSASTASHAASTVKPPASNNTNNEAMLTAAPVFVMPAQGEYTLTTRPNGGIGLLFNGHTGQEIRAAAAGRVVYSGTGLLGYGQLLIIKHNDQYLSAYAHLQNAAVKEGDEVTSGQTIAAMGNGPAGAPQLYFEIRFNGRPVDPSTFLRSK
jgi:lipoprotein NlpD